MSGQGGHSSSLIETTDETLYVRSELLCGHCPVLDDPFGNQSGPDQQAIRKLLIAIFLCFIFMIVELVGGYLSGSLAIITDAAHLLSDVAGFLVSLFAITWSRKRASSSMSYGYHRAEILGALLSISLVWSMTFYLLVEAVERLRNPVTIDGKIMTVIAAFGVAVNGIIGLVLHDHTGHDHSHDIGDFSGSNLLTANAHSHRHEHAKNINVHAAFIHAIGDLIQSIGVLIAALIIWFKPGWQIADPLCTFLFSILVIASTWFLARDTILILMEGTPKNVVPLDIQRELASINGVFEVHDLHVWSLAPGKASATVHIVIDWERQISDPSLYESILTQCQKIICRYNIHHATIQIDPTRLLDVHCRVNCCGSTENFLAGDASR